MLTAVGLVPLLCITVLLENNTLALVATINICIFLPDLTSVWVLLFASDPRDRFAVEVRFFILISLILIVFV